MKSFAAILVGLIVGAVVFASGPGLLVGAALGAMIGWCLNLQKRVATLERAQQAAAAPRGPMIPAVRKYLDDRDAVVDDRHGSPEPVTDGPSGTDAGGQSVTLPAGSAEPVYRAPTTRPQRQPESTSPIDLLLSRCRIWLTTGNIPVKVGVILSVFGLAFLVKEAVDRSWLVLPIELRLFGVAVFGAVLLGLGWRLRSERMGYGLSLQGGGIAIIYLTTFVAYGIYALIAAPVAFVLLVLTTLSAGILAVTQNARVLAVLGIVGGFMAPVLASDGGGDHIVLFSYYAVLNCAIFGIAWLRAWRELNLLGFVFTFVIGSLWGYTAYAPAQFASTEPFLVLFFLMYVCIPVFFARLSPPVIRGFVDGTLVFGAPLIAFSLQIALVGDTQFGLAWSAAALAMFYAGLSTVLLLRGADYMRVLGEAFAGLALAFIAIAVPLALDAQSTSLSWAVQGAAMCWLGWRQNRRLALAAGVVLQGLAAAAYFLSGPDAFGLPAILNGPYLGALMLAAAAAWSGRMFDRIEDSSLVPFRARLAGALLIWATLVWLVAGAVEIERVVPNRYWLSTMLVFLGGTVSIAAGAVRLFDWPRPAALGFLLFPTLSCGLILALVNGGHTFANFGWLAWASLLCSHLFYLYRCEHGAPRLGSVLHAFGYCIFTLVVAAEIYWQLDRQLPGVWPASLLLALIGVLMPGTVRLANRIAWPFGAHWRAYAVFGTGLIGLSAALTMLALNAFSSGAAGPIGYMPLLNPLELASIGFTCCGVHYLRSIGAREGVASLAARYERPAAAALGMYLLTMVVARSVHHYADVPFRLDTLAASEVFQSTLSIIWGMAAFSGMIAGAHRHHRFVWLAGAGLMGIVVVKLFLVDLANTGTVERVISFLGVGVLLLVVGYFAPVPPKNAVVEGFDQEGVAPTDA